MSENYWFKLTMRRAESGVRFTVRADTRVEEFFKGLGSGKPTPIELFGKVWLPVNKPLMAYHVSEELEVVSRLAYSILPVGSDIESDGIINLSFLRLEGISSEGGVSFTINSPMSYAKVGNLKASILEGVKIVLKDYIIPFNVTMEVISREG